MFGRHKKIKEKNIKKNGNLHHFHGSSQEIVVNDDDDDDDDEFNMSSITKENRKRDIVV